MVLHLASQLHYVRLDDGELFYRRALDAGPIAGTLTDYAIFRADILRDHEGAEILHKEALGIDPNDPYALDRYAIFLTDIRRDYDGAEALYKKALEITPENEQALGNYAKCLFLRGRFEDAMAFLANAFSRRPSAENLLCELHFYAYAHAWERWPNSLGALKDLLQAGANSKDWPLQENVRVAIRQGHPAPEFLAALARVVSGETSVDTLTAFPEWQTT
jgi:tetratricopeptide (TPR) repeat protein